MRAAKGAVLILSALVVCSSASAQIRIISREKRDSVANPVCLNSADMFFDRGRHLDFGTMPEEGGAVTKRLQWQNRSDRPMVITRITTSCGCVVCDFGRTAVDGGKSDNIAITYHPKGHPGSMRHRLFIYTDRSTEAPTAIVDIEGRVIASADRSGDYPHAIGTLLLRSRKIVIDRSKNGVQSARIACMNGGNTTLTPRIDHLISAKGFTLECEPKCLQAGEEGDLVISYNPREGIKGGAMLFIENRNLPPRDREIKILEAEP